MSRSPTYPFSCHEDAIWGVEWTGKDQVVSASADGSLRVWDKDGNLLHAPAPHALGIVSLSVSPSGSRSLTNSVDGTTMLHSLDDGSLLSTHESFFQSDSDREGKSTRVDWSVSLHPEEKIYAACGAGGKIALRNAEVGDGFGKEIKLLDSGREKFGMNCKFSPDGKLVALASETGHVYIFDVESGHLSASYSSHNVSVRALAWSPDGQFLYSGSDDKSIILHDIRHSSGKSSSGVSTLTGHSSWVLSLSCTHDNRLLSGSSDKTVRLWDTRAGGQGGSKGGCLGSFGENAEVWGVAWRPVLEADMSKTGKRFVSGGDEKVVRWWRAAGSQ
ncbi:FOG: WD40 repeat [Phaffia rhodozyma]|uniref:FOG: WD40 repeat n=1 Tax=Phaffia rhodozyma TaxID=264483 RepID=A0A0F7SUA1_PHARH|nr:FOG: WD40 repeat [Phaffia rhodozyma]